MKGLKLPDTREETYTEVIMRDDYLADKERQGFRIVEPGDTEVFVDVDSEEDYKEFLSRLSRLSDAEIKCHCTSSPSTSGLPHRHIKVNFFYSLTDWQRVALQWMLNSDPTRELLTVLRLLRGESRPIIFFEKEGDK